MTTFFLFKISDELKKLEEQSTRIVVTKKHNKGVKADVYIKQHPNLLEQDWSFLKFAMCTLDMLRQSD